MKRILPTRWNQSVQFSAGDSCGPSDSAAGYFPNCLLGDPGRLRCRAIGIDSKEGIPDCLLNVPGGALVDESMIMEGSLDTSLMRQIQEFAQPASLREREVDPMLLGLCSSEVPTIPEDTSIMLARRQEIEAVHRRLGAGTFGEVFHCTLKGSGQEVAVKVLHKGSDKSQKREVELLGQLKHDNLVDFICLLDGPPDALVLELCVGGCLADALHGQKAQQAGVKDLGLRPRACAVLDVLSAVEYLHTHNIIHRDIKPGNVFLTATASTPMIDLPPVKLGDLGLARELDSHMTQCTGTWRYMAPEVLTSNNYSESADVYSCGILLHEVFSGKLPFDGLNAVRVAQAVTMGQRPDPKDINGPTAIIDALGAVLDACWTEAPADRVPASYLAQCIKPLAKGA